MLRIDHCLSRSGRTSAYQRDQDHSVLQCGPKNESLRVVHSRTKDPRKLKVRVLLLLLEIELNIWIAYSRIDAVSKNSFPVFYSFCYVCLSEGSSEKLNILPGIAACKLTLMVALISTFQAPLSATDHVCDVAAFSTLSHLVYMVRPSFSPFPSCRSCLLLFSAPGLSISGQTPGRALDR